MGLSVSTITKTNCDAGTDDPKLALLTDLAAAIDAINAIIAAAQADNARLTTLSAITAQQATDLAALSTFMGTVLDDANAATALATLGAPLNATLDKSAAYTALSADRGKLIDCTGAGGWTLGFDAAATLGVWASAVRNSTTGTITLDPYGSEQIDGASTLALAAGESCFVLCNGTALKTVGLAVNPGQAKVSSNDTTAGYLNGKLVAGTNVTLTEGSDGADETLTIAMSGSYVPTNVGSGASVAVGTFALIYNTGASVAAGASGVTANLRWATFVGTTVTASAVTPSGTWLNISGATVDSSGFGIFQRIA